MYRVDELAKEIGRLMAFLVVGAAWIFVFLMMVD